MPVKLLEIEATFIEERMRFDDVLIGCAHANGTINSRITIKGEADPDELNQHQTYRFYGKWSDYKNNRTGDVEKQFHFTSFVAQQPAGRAGIIAYLRAAGEGNGFGQARASKLWELYGPEAVKVIRETPDIAAAALSHAGLKLAKEHAEHMAECLREQAALESCTIELIDLLGGKGFPKTLPRAVVREWGNRGAELIRANPYRLMQFRSCGFKRCDQLYLDLKLPADAIRRQAHCLWYTLAKDTEGHTWFPLGFGEAGLKSSIAGASVNLSLARRYCRRARATAEMQTAGIKGPISAAGNITWIAEGPKARNEATIAELIADAIREPAAWPDVNATDSPLVDAISIHQREKLAAALAGPVAILGGSPGTGKTYTAAALIRCLVAIHGREHIAVAAPTGKAAVRISEALESYGVPLRARTIHSLLMVEQRDGRDGWGFHYREGNPLPFKFIVVDETSMVDTNLMCSLLSARAAEACILFVGDVNQLAPVGHGAPLRDFITAGLPYGELREIKRNSGGIVEACAAIRDGKPWKPGDNLIMAERHGAESQIAGMLETIHTASAVEYGGHDPIWDCQVLVAVNAKSDLSRKALNKLLQSELNPNAGNGGTFRAGDKIVNLKNGYFPAVEFDADDPDSATNDKGEVYVANGELAEVVEVQEKMIVAQLWSPDRTVKIPRGKASESASDKDGDDMGGSGGEETTSTGCTWDLGYALSVHKSQGSEWPVVIYMVDDYPGAKMVCSREHIYTGISRAKQKCILIGKKTTADGFCRTPRLSKRKTFLAELIAVENAKRELAGM